MASKRVNGFIWTAARLGLQVSSISGDFCVKAFGFELFRDDLGRWSFERCEKISEHPLMKFGRKKDKTPAPDK